MNFNEENLFEKLLNASNSEKDSVSFGIIGMDSNNKIFDYNKVEEGLSSYKKDFVLGKDLFIDIAPCMNNYLVALKFEEREEMDEIIPYILSFKVKPVSVELRLIKKSDKRYVLIKRG